MTTWNCPKCHKLHGTTGVDDEGKELRMPGFVMGDSGKIVAECTKCQATDERVTPASFNSGVASLKDEAAAGAAPGWGGKKQVVVQTQEAPPAAYQPPAMAMPQAMPVYAAQPLGSSLRIAPPPTLDPSLPIEHQIEQRALYLASEEARIDGEIAALTSQRAGIRVESQKLRKMLRASHSVQAQPATSPARTGEAHDGSAQGSLPIEH